MRTRQRDRVYLRYIGPADRSHGEYRGQAVELIGDTDDGSAWIVFPDGSLSRVHWDHLTDAPFRMVVES